MLVDSKCRIVNRIEATDDIVECPSVELTLVRRLGNLAVATLHGIESGRLLSEIHDVEFKRGVRLPKCPSGQSACARIDNHSRVRTSTSTSRNNGH
jgi:hypothetical protein